MLNLELFPHVAQRKRDYFCGGCVSEAVRVSWCPVRGQRLKEVLQLHEFRRETSELDEWMIQQRQTAECQDLGNDYQHVQVSHVYTVTGSPSTRGRSRLYFYTSSPSSCYLMSNWNIIIDIFVILLVQFELTPFC